MKDGNNIDTHSTRVFLIEDEYYAAQELKRSLSALRPDYVLAGEAEDVEGIVDYLSHNTVDLIIADIRLSDGYSFDAFERLSIVDVPIIFTTAYNQYQSRARSYHLIDFLLKPVVPKLLERALVKFEKEQNI